MGVRPGGRGRPRRPAPVPRASRPIPPPAGLALEVQVGRGLQAVAGRGELGRWAAAALAAVPRRERPRAQGVSVTLRLVGQAEGTRLNEGYRPGKQGPTNVLSFPGPDPHRMPPGEVPNLGDIVVCLPVVRQEAAAQGRPLRAHLAHLVVHGMLHLLGHTHEGDRDARRMEAVESKVMKNIGFPDPHGGPRGPRHRRGATGTG